MLCADNKAKCQSLLLVLTLLRQQEEHRKEFVVQNYDLIKSVINLLKGETVPRLVRIEIEVIAHCILRDTLSYNPLNPQD
jgi:hypothetical protein